MFDSFPGASVKDVEQMVTVTCRASVEPDRQRRNVMSVSRPGLAIIGAV